MRIQDIIISILLFAIVTVVLVGVAVDMYEPNEGFNVTIADEYILDESHPYKETTDLVSGMADSAPGGIEGPQLTDLSSGSDIIGLDVMGLIFKTPGIAKKIIMGEHNETNSSQITKYGLTTAFGINPMFAALLITAIILIISIILISSVLRNRW